MKKMTHKGMMWGLIPVYVQFHMCDQCDEEHVLSIGRNELCERLIDAMHTLIDVICLPATLFLGHVRDYTDVAIIVTGKISK